MRLIVLIIYLLVWLIFLAGWKFGVPPEEYDSWEEFAEYRRAGNHPPIQYTTPTGTTEIQPDW